MAAFSPVGAIVKQGDSFTIQVTYSNSSVVDLFTLMADVAVGSIPKLSAIGGVALADISGSGTVNSPYILPSKTVTITIDRPLDSKGAPIKGLNYNASVSYQWPRVSPLPSQTSDNFPVNSQGTSKDFEDSSTGSSPVSFQITVKDTVTVDGVQRSTKAEDGGEITIEFAASSKSGSSILHGSRVNIQIP